jgi:hypothetical protein
MFWYVEHQSRFCGHGNIRSGQNTTRQIELFCDAELRGNGRYDCFRYVNWIQYIGN